MDANPKRTVQVNVKMRPRDFARLKKAAKAAWGDADLTNSRILLGLAKLGADTVLDEKSEKKER